MSTVRNKSAFETFERHGTQGRRNRSERRSDERTHEPQAAPASKSNSPQLESSPQAAETMLEELKKKMHRGRGRAGSNNKRCVRQPPRAFRRVLVSALIWYNIVNDARSPRRRSVGDDHGQAGAHIRRTQAHSRQASMAVHDGTVWIAEHNPRAHRNQLVHKKLRRFEHFLVDEGDAFTCVAMTVMIEFRSAGKPGQGASSILGICPPISGTTRSSPIVLGLNTVPLSSHVTPSFEKPTLSGGISSAHTPSIRRSPPVTAASPTTEPSSM